MNTLQLAKAHPEAFAALPECYQADDCLLFWQDREGFLYATPKVHQVFALGDWEAVFINGRWKMGPKTMITMIKVGSQ
jgi:hypothetical protein